MLHNFKHLANQSVGFVSTYSAFENLNEQFLFLSFEIHQPIVLVPGEWFC